MDRPEDGEASVAWDPEVLEGPISSSGASGASGDSYACWKEYQALKLAA